MAATPSIYIYDEDLNMVYLGAKLYKCQHLASEHLQKSKNFSKDTPPSLDPSPGTPIGIPSTQEILGTSLYAVVMNDSIKCRRLQSFIRNRGQEALRVWLSLYTPKDATKGLGFMPKRGLDVNAHEVARFYRLVDRGLCEPTSMIVPRKSELFQNDIYPPCMSIEPSMTTDEWLKGANKPRKDMDMETLFKGTSVAAPAKRSSRLGRSTAASTAPANSQPKAEPNAAPVTAKAPVSRAASNPPKEEVRGGQETKEQKNQLERLLAEVNELKATVKTQEERIATLEAAQD
ncbi:putative coronin-1B-like [Apostichopus japonicus]|uniref:Putative coronin-1B-like n=1 Tax=Stichopus japonicus TaxID=307972 RepID=A0A2G8JSJ8_STIJA|nr:putative coronin-1B-like [Apostichopus japonicus]